MPSSRTSASRKASPVRPRVEVNHAELEQPGLGLGDGDLVGVEAEGMTACPCAQLMGREFVQG